MSSATRRPRCVTANDSPCRTRSNQRLACWRSSRTRALGNVLGETGVGKAMADAIAGLSLPGFLIPFMIATVVRLAQGSGTVAMITAGSLTAPLLGSSLELDPVLAALAATAGSMFFSYYNDSYFWVVTKFTGLDGTAALRGWSGITTVAWAGSLVLLALLSLIL